MIFSNVSIRRYLGSCIRLSVTMLVLTSASMNSNWTCCQLQPSFPKRSTIRDIQRFEKLCCSFGLKTQTVPITTLFLNIAEEGTPRIVRVTRTLFPPAKSSAQTRYSHRKKLACCYVHPLASLVHLLLSRDITSIFSRGTFRKVAKNS